MKLLRSLPVRTLLVSALISFSSLTSWAQTANAPGRITQAVDMQNMVTLRGNTHPLARPEFDQGAAPDSLPMERMLLVLQRSTEQEATLRKLLDEQQIKSSPNFHMWLTPEQFGQQFGPVDADVQAVTDWLGSQGFEVSRVAAGRTVIEFSGTAGAVRQAFHTEIHKFVVNGQEHWANASDPQIPAALAPVVTGFASLNNFPREPMIRRLGTFSRSKATGEVQPLFTYLSPSANTTYYAVGPWDFATIYNVAPLWTAGIDGTGQTVAVVADSNINPQDVADFRAMFGLPANPPNIILNGPDPGINDDEGEAALDVQWSGAVAKGATIDLVVSESTEATAGLDLSALYTVDNSLAPVMSVSYSACEAYFGASGNLFHSTLWEEAAAQGITVVVAAGDSGSAGCDYFGEPSDAALYGLAVNGLASTPFSVAVGGTDFNDLSTLATYWNPSNSSPDQNSAKSYIPELPWNGTCASSGSLNGCSPPPQFTYFQEGFDLVAGGGGLSSCTSPSGTFPSITCSGGYSKPFWQSGTGVPSDGARDLPDLSLFAGNGFNASFYVLCQMDANSSEGGSSTSCDLSTPYTDFQAAGGTSASAQVFAGIMALVNQAQGRQGNANYVLYPLAAQAGNTCVSNTAAVSRTFCIFYDITTGNNSVICQAGSPNCSNTNPNADQYGIMVSAGSAAYRATSGYDLATGLGSVNVANLVNNWTSVSFRPTTTAVSLSTSPATNPITLTHGQPINFTINVASGSGTPAGDASLTAQTGNSTSNVTGIGPFTLTGGSVSGSTSMLPSGTYTVTAHYAGNGTFAASDSSPGIPVTVGKESSLTEVRLATPNAAGLPVYNLTTVPYGSVYILRMDVTNSSRQPCANPITELIAYPCATGSLTVTPAPTDENPPPGTVPGSYILNSQGYAEDQPIQQPPGVYNFTATYSGDNSYKPSTSPAVPITITQAPTTTVLGFGSPAWGLINFTPNITTQSNGVGPTGTVQLFDGTTQLGSPVQVSGAAYVASTNTFASARAWYQTNLAPGPHSITGQYSGDSNYAGSTSAVVPVTVSDYTFAVNPTSVNISTPGQAGTATVTLTPLFGFNGIIYLSCYASVSDPGITCTFSPATINLTGSSAQTSTVTITTTASSSGSPPPPQPKAPSGLRSPPRWFRYFPGLLALAVFVSLIPRCRCVRAAALASALLILGVWAACGGGGGRGNSATSPSYPNASFGPVSLSFGQQAMNTPSPLKSASLTNAAGGLLSISSITLGGTNAGDFSQTNNCISLAAAADSCTFIVGFTPTAAGPRSASIVVTDYDSANGQQTQTLPLTGTGTQPLVSISPTHLTFGKQVQYTQSAPQTLTLTNISGAPVSFYPMDIEGLNYGDFNVGTDTCGINVALAPAANCTVGVSFVAFDTGPLSALLSVVLNGSPSQQTVPLSGTGVLPPTPPGTYSFNVQAEGNGDQHTTTIYATVL